MIDTDSRQQTGEAALEDSTMQQHNAVLNARLQNQPDSSVAASEYEDDVLQVDAIQAIQTTPFKSTLDSNGPIPGL